ncbi:Cytochrome b6-f complex iron-sulfur subunit [Streptomyces sp. enrichment culture]|uniref:Rieske (2Fe-2S) protein n=1 Tax=Streptomyces sp. enrichment culture TaxID=1795815 RepID=UPI003F556A6D
MTHSATRRTVLLTTVATGATAFTTAACGGGDDDGGSSSASESPAADLARTGDIPVGGGKVFKERKVVVTQPEEGDFKAFSAVCTHQGCVVADVSGGTINCACHNSKFALTDGAVRQGPATEPLPAQQITVEGNSVRLT